MYDTFQCSMTFETSSFSVLQLALFYSCSFTIFMNPYTEICFLSQDVNDYPMQSQGKTSIPGVDDGEEGFLTDVSFSPSLESTSSSLSLSLIYQA
jgi:hypothetical protein